MQGQISASTIAEACYGADLPLLAASTGNTNLPTWADTTPQVKSMLTARVATTLDGLRSNGRGSVQTMHAAGDSGGSKPGPNSYGDPLRDAIFTNIVTTAFEYSQTPPQG